jgi:hypothetical protein
MAGTPGWVVFDEEEDVWGQGATAEEACADAVARLKAHTWDQGWERTEAGLHFFFSGPEALEVIPANEPGWKALGTGARLRIADTAEGPRAVPEEWEED